jgi:hypothetical protein
VRAAGERVCHGYDTGRSNRSRNGSRWASRVDQVQGEAPLYLGSEESAASISRCMKSQGRPGAGWFAVDAVRAGPRLEIDEIGSELAGGSVSPSHCATCVGTQSAMRSAEIETLWCDKVR